MLAALTNTRLMNGIKKASPFGQTSALEGFHSVLNQFSPKMIGYSYRGMFCRYVKHHGSDFACFVYLTTQFALKYFRHAIAVIHFNKNLNRINRMKNGVEQLHVVYPKFKNGEAVVRNVKVQQNFGMYIAFSLHSKSLQHFLLSRKIYICTSQAHIPY
jgi:hypothetical protein